MEEKVDQLDIDTNYYLDIEQLLIWLNKAQLKGAVKLLLEGNINNMLDEVDTVSIKAFSDNDHKRGF